MRNSRVINGFSWILITVLIVTFACAFGITISKGTAFATDSEILLSTITIGHLSDIHYFPYNRGFTSSDSGYTEEKYYVSDFYHSMTGDTKVVEESAAVFDKSCEEIFDAALAGKCPQIFIASGDLCKNGEKDALIDLSNRLRLLQNDIRHIPGYENFQIIAIPGNHDLFNDAGAYYTPDIGKTVKCDGLQTSEFALMFAGLGYPDLTLSELEYFFPSDYWSTDTGNSFNRGGVIKDGYTFSKFTGDYIESTTSSLYEFEYYDENLQYVYENKSSMTEAQLRARYLALEANRDDLKCNVLSFVMIPKSSPSFAVFGIDASFRSEGSCFVPFLSETKTTQMGEDYYKYIENVGFEQVTQGVANSMLMNNEMVYVDCGLDHETGGKITTNCVDWVEEKINLIKQTTPGDGGKEYTFFITMHQNLLEHWEMEGEILKDFTLYNYEYLVNRLLNAGVRYAFTGHMHANDITYYTNPEGKTFYDIETGSLASYCAPKRYITLERYAIGTELSEKFIIENDLLETFDFDTNGNGVIDDDPSEKNINYNDYTNKRVYSQLIDRILGHFLSNNMVDGLLETLDSTIRNISKGSGTAATILGQYSNTLADLAATLINQLRTKLDYTYNGENYSNLVDYVSAIANDIVSMEFGNDLTPYGKLNIKAIAGFVAAAHSAGFEITTGTYYGTSPDYIFSKDDAGYVVQSPTDPDYRESYIAALQDLHNQCVDGSFVKKLLDTLLKPLFLNDNGLIKQILNYKFDLSVDANGNPFPEDSTSDGYQDGDTTIEEITDLVDTINTLVEALIGEENADTISIVVSNFVIGDIVNSAFPMLKGILQNTLGFGLPGNNLIDAINTFLDSYLVDSFYVGIGGIAEQIVRGFATDDMPDYANPANPYVKGILSCKESLADATYTYRSDILDPYTPSQLKGSIPSIVNGHFEEISNNKTSYTLTYYTDETIFTAVELYDNNGTKLDEVIQNQYYVDSYEKFDNGAIYGDIILSDSTKLFTLNSNSTKINITSVATPIYYPLIDLGLVALTHTAVFKETASGDEVPIIYSDRDMYYDTNSVKYWNKHTVTFKDLDPATIYQFKIAGTYKTLNGDLLKFYLGGENGTAYKFETNATETTENYSFLALADIQGMTPNMYYETQKALNIIASNNKVNDYKFVLNAGDIGDNSKNFTQMQYAFDLQNDFFTKTSTFVASGNHENESYMMNRFFDYTIPNGSQQTGITGLYYSFDYATSHFVVLDTNDANSDGLGEGQLTWLKNDLQKANENSSIKFIFVMMHKSLYSTGSHSMDNEVIAMRKQLTPIFYDYNVDIVFSGHDHTYSITKNLDKNGKITTDTNGVLYITLGTAGTKFYEYRENNDVTSLLDSNNSILSTLTSQTFAYIKVAGDMLYLNGYQINKEDESIKLITDVGAFDGDLTKEISAARASVENGAKADFFSRTIKNTNFDSNKLPQGYKYEFVLNGKNYNSINDIKLSGGKNVEIEVYLLNTNTNDKVKIDTINASIENYALGIALWVIIPVVVLGAVAACVIILLKKKNVKKQ